jgi:DNA ligase-1
MTFKPLLAAPVDWDKLTYDDLLLSAKLDGIRAIVINGVVLSRSLKPIPNKHVQTLFGHLEHYDGELICGQPFAHDVYRKTNSAVMSIEGEPDVTFYAFDHVEESDADYLTRWERLEDSDGVVVLPQFEVSCREDIEGLELTHLDQGYEGVMLRKSRGPNSRSTSIGRATAKSCTLLKVKRFQDSEARITGFEELHSNQNEATTDALGHTVRSNHQANMRPMGTLGALVCVTVEGVEFKIGSGFDAATRQTLWNSRFDLLDAWVKYKHFPVGVLDAPRFPIFLGIRDAVDL